MSQAAPDTSQKISTQTTTSKSLSDQHKQNNFREDLEGEAPEQVRISKDKKTMTLIWSDGAEKSISASELRDNCRSAQSVKLRITNLAVPAPKDLAIKDVKPIGSYGINIVYSDDFDRGIYPWGYLQKIVNETKETNKS